MCLSGFPTQSNFWHHLTHFIIKRGREKKEKKENLLQYVTFRLKALSCDIFEPRHVIPNNVAF